MKLTFPGFGGKQDKRRERIYIATKVEDIKFEHYESAAREYFARVTELVQSMNDSYAAVKDAKTSKSAKARERQNFSDAFQNLSTIAHFIKALYDRAHTHEQNQIAANLQDMKESAMNSYAEMQKKSLEMQG
ncbi:MAG: hypothetical protein RLZZ283_101 [Candidatus Parcubacteria bacterium]|jgi:hypothetical protein